MDKALEPGDETERLARLAGLALPAGETAPGLQALAECAARLTGCAGAYITLIDDRQQRVHAAFGASVPAVLPRELALCSHMLADGRLLEVSDARADPRFAAHPLVTGAPFVRFYASQPLRVGGAVLGSVCVLDTVPRRLDEGMRRSLAELADAAAALLRAQRALREREHEQQRLADFARASGDWLWEADAQGRYTWIAGAFEAITGDRIADWIGREITDAPLLDVDGRPLADGRRLHDLLRAGAPFARVITERQTPGPYFVISRSAVPVHDADGTLCGWRGTTRDLTARMRLQRASREREELLRKLAAQLPGALHQFRIDADGRASFPYASDALAWLFGLQPGDVRDRPERMFEHIHPDDHARVQAAVARSRRSGSAWRQEYRVRRPDGSEVWVESHALPEKLPDGSTVWHGYSADITQRKAAQLELAASEERWSLAGDATGIGVARLDLTDQSLHFDRRACLNHGWPFPHERLTLDGWAAQIVEEDREAALAAVQRAIAQRERLELRYRFRLGDGSVRWLEVFARAQYAPDGRPLTLIGTCRDVTTQQQAEQLALDKQTAERASRAKSELMSRLSHELRTPLNGILGFAQLMALDAEEPLGPLQRRRLEGVQRAGRHLLQLVDDVLELTQLDQGTLALALRSVDLVRALETSLAMVRPLAAPQAVRLPPVLPAGPRWVRADARALEQVLVNLLSNAIQYNRPGGTVQVEIASAPGRLAVVIADQGPGLGDDEQARLFQPFQRLAGEGRSAGRGLGLVIARRLAEAMGGSLTASSRRGEGSRFRVELPRADHAGADSGPATLLTMPLALDEGRPPRRVLYIEDEPLNALLMEEVFRTQPGWSLVVARDGASGLRQAHELQPDLLLVDMNLPDMNGLQLIERLRADPATAGLHCIALSADAMVEQMEAARAAGFADYWTKPIDVAQLPAALARVIDERGAPPGRA